MLTHTRRWFVPALFLALSLATTVHADDLTALRQRAESGDVASQYLLGLRYDNGQGLAQNSQEAFAWYRKAADQGYAAACNNLGVMYQTGQGVAKDLVEARKWFHRAAEKGFALAQYNLGLMYAQGQGVDKDPAEARRWYQKAADQGNAGAQTKIGVMDRAQSDSVARVIEKWEEKTPPAAVAKNAPVPSPVVPPVAPVAVTPSALPVAGISSEVKDIHQAAGQGNSDAQTKLGVKYLNGSGVAKDYGEAIAWFVKAAEQGYPPAENELGVMYFNGEGVTRNYELAFRWFQLAAEQGYDRAQNNLGVMHFQGLGGGPQDFGKAYSWYRLAANQGLSGAQRNLGSLYFNGQGVEKDKVAAFVLLSRAADKGDATARSILPTVKRTMSPAQVVEAQRRLVGNIPQQ